MKKPVFALVLVSIILLSGCVTQEPAAGPAAGEPSEGEGVLPTRISSVGIQSINIITDTEGVPDTASFTVRAALQGEAGKTVTYSCKATYFDGLLDPGINMRKDIPSEGEVSDTFTLSVPARGKSPQKSSWGVCCELMPLSAFVEGTATMVCARGV